MFHNDLIVVLTVRAADNEPIDRLLFVNLKFYFLPGLNKCLDNLSAVFELG